MSCKSYSKEIKLKMAKAHAGEGISFYKFEKTNDISFGAIRHWLAAYKAFGDGGLEKANSMLYKHPAEIKKKIVDEYQTGHLCAGTGIEVA